MMPQDFPSAGFERAAALAAVQTRDARTATALVRVEREIRELQQQWAGTEAGRRDLTPEIVPALAALSDRVEALTLELRASARHDARPLLASARHHRHHPA
ncbi:MAG: hypothetical protein ABJA74_01165 [Lapillicoccus sp.]